MLNLYKINVWGYLSMIKKIAAAILCAAFVAAFIPAAWAAEKVSAKGAVTVSPLTESLEILRKDLSSYFISLEGAVTSIEGDIISINRGSSEAIKQGMRLNVFKEGASFSHPVTKEFIGKMEIPIGAIEITSVAASTSRGKIISGKPSEFKGSNIKIAGKKVRLMFYQGNTDWNLADAYFRILLDSNRFDMIDTGLQSVTEAELMTEAKKKGAEVVVILNSVTQKNTIELTQRLYWVNDSRQFSAAATTIALGAVKQLKFSSGAFAWKQGEALMTYKLPFSANRMAIGDFSGNGQLDLVLASDNHIAIYKLDVDLKLLWEFRTPGSGNILWIDTLDVNGDGRDEILITTATGVRSNIMAYSIDDGLQIGDSDTRGTVRSFIYSMDKEKFKPIWRGENMFIRALEKKVTSQAFSNTEGFDGKLYPLEFKNGRFTRGQPISITKGLNIYDFQFVYAPDGRRGYFAWDEVGYVNFYNDKGVRTWVSKEEFGGFADSFKKESKNIMLDKGSWTMKDKFVTAHSEVLAPKRNAMFGFVNIKSLGYSSSELRSFWWNGITVEERSYLEEVSGTILDYVVVGDRLLVMVKPYLINMEAVNALIKLENPMGIMLYVFSTKGR
jgi:hypothetical protein